MFLEYQLVKQGSDRRETILSEVMEDNEDDKITMASMFILILSIIFKEILIF